MEEKKRGKRQLIIIGIMIFLMVASFVAMFQGYYRTAFVFFGILVAIMSFIGTRASIDNRVYLHTKNYKNNNRW
ncbi:hypothetical protein [Ureibacillus chungkukjangi]|uniref:Uncharacterized protein n=1 Tax=Ureibacillus chungkukjangi TaxID=1202712 RepID=A0A318TWU3_9BACL|nr:hypothetical protein [Ureibacillus chungkukjangi]MCM3388314.1 hypothetical protein [Ureibacillus chungkukjangi]PYF08390.1 hypothetical protein BJ095_102156 [Ureibacillus chungkukjangi]